MKPILKEIHEEVPKMVTTEPYNHPYDNGSWYVVWFDREIPIFDAKYIELGWEFDYGIDNMDADSDSDYDSDEFIDYTGQEAIKKWYIPEMV
tara:strand:+ start:399 stop:674 length:276 start_codon:yes stop_codon:yes gene_type:complete